MIQAGNIAALKAIQQYNINYGSNINSYVKTAIRNAIYEEAAHFYGPYALSKGVLSLAAKIISLTKQGKSDKEIAKILNKNIGLIKDLRLLYTGSSQDLESLTISSKTANLQLIDLSDIEIDILRYRLQEKMPIEKVTKLLELSRTKLMRLEAKLKIKLQELLSYE